MSVQLLRSWLKGPAFMTTHTPERTVWQLPLEPDGCQTSTCKKTHYPDQPAKRQSKSLDQCADNSWTTSDKKLPANFGIKSHIISMPQRSFHSAAVGFRQKWKCLKSIFSAIPGPKPIPMRRYSEARNTPYSSHQVFVKLESIRIHHEIIWLRTPYTLSCLQTWANDLQSEPAQAGFSQFSQLQKQPSTIWNWPTFWGTVRRGLHDMEEVCATLKKAQKAPG